MKSNSPLWAPTRSQVDCRPLWVDSLVPGDRIGAILAIGDFVGTSDHGGLVDSR